MTEEERRKSGESGEEVEEEVIKIVTKEKEVK